MPRRYPSPPVRLRDRLIELRGYGWAFDRAWQRALYEGFPWTSGKERHDWIDALTAFEDEWRAAYELRPTLLAAQLAAVETNRHTLGDTTMATVAA